MFPTSSNNPPTENDSFQSIGSEENTFRFTEKGIKRQQMDGAANTQFSYSEKIVAALTKALNNIGIQIGDSIAQKDGIAIKHIINSINPTQNEVIKIFFNPTDYETRMHTGEFFNPHITRYMLLKPSCNPDNEPEVQIELTPQIPLLLPCPAAPPCNTLDYQLATHLISPSKKTPLLAVTMPFFGTDLYAYLKENNALSIQEAFVIFKDILNEIKSNWDFKRLVHRDIKLGNIFFKKNAAGTITSAFLADYGISRTNHPRFNTQQTLSSPTSPKGTPGYVAPEVVTINEDHQHIGQIPFINYQQDMWSIGVVLFSLLSKSNKNREIYFTPNQQELDDILKNPIITTEDRRIIISLFNKIFKREPGSRINADQALQLIQNLSFLR